MKSISNQLLLMGLLSERQQEAESVNSTRNKKRKVPLFVVEADNYLSKLESVSKRSKSTIENISNSLSQFANYMLNIHSKRIAIEKFGIDLCTADNVLLWLQHEMTECKNSARTRNLKLSHIREFMFDVSNRYPLYGSLYIKLMNITPLREEEKAKLCLSDAQVVAIIKAAVTMNKGVRNGTMLLLMSETAVRVQELVSAKVRDLDLSDEHPRLQVMGKGRKYRVIPLNKETLKVMKNYMSKYHTVPTEDEPLFYSKRDGVHKALTTKMVRTIIKECGDKARFSDPTIPLLACHIFRRSRATALYQNGCPIEIVATLLGHSSPDTTSQYYAKPSDLQLKEAQAKSDLNIGWNDIDSADKESNKRRSKTLELLRKSKLKIKLPNLS